MFIIFFYNHFSCRVWVTLHSFLVLLTCDFALFFLISMPVINLLLLCSEKNFTACSAIMEVDSVTLSSLTVGTMLCFVSRGHWRVTPLEKKKIPLHGSSVLFKADSWSRCGLCRPHCRLLQLRAWSQKHTFFLAEYNSRSTWLLQHPNPAVLSGQ